MGEFTLSEQTVRSNARFKSLESAITLKSMASIQEDEKSVIDLAQEIYEYLVKDLKSVDL